MKIRLQIFRVAKSLYFFYLEKQFVKVDFLRCNEIDMQFINIY